MEWRSSSQLSAALSRCTCPPANLCSVRSRYGTTASTFPSILREGSLEAVLCRQKDLSNLPSRLFQTQLTGLTEVGVGAEAGHAAEGTVEAGGADLRSTSRP